MVPNRHIYFHMGNGACNVTGWVRGMAIPELPLEQAEYTGTRGGAL